ncbi:eukaryotic translation initiation factor 4 gamma 1-like isoform X1 [Nelusetta ayraudi]|uniref:eukaryotic translation initiation factor 4 gamma 1-like isoform X1 n=1 Tax=Nelusetta ayraudi TaxID=303726 RepID=UPI003F6F93A1
MRHRSLGNIKFIGELFKMKMLTASIMDDCIVKLLKNHDEESLECLCRLLSTVGKNLDFKKAKPRMDQHFNQIERIIKERKTSSRIRFMLQDVLDLRKNNWVPRRRDQGPKTIDQIHKDAKLEEQLEQIEVHQQLLSKREAGGRMGESGGGHHTLGGGRTSQSHDDGWNTMTKNVNVAHLRKAFTQDWNNLMLRPGSNKVVCSKWGQGCSGGSGEQDSGRITANFNQFSVLQRPSSLFTLSDSDRKVTHRSSSSFDPGDEKNWSDRDRDWFEQFDSGEGWQGRDGRNSQSQTGKRSFLKELQERGGKGRDNRDSVEIVRHVTDGRDKGSREKWGGNRSHIKDPTAKYKGNTNPPPLPKPALTEEEVARKSTAIIEEYLHINDLKEASQCVTELNSASLLYVFVRRGVESTLERRTVARERIGLLLYQLVKAGMLPKQQFYKGLAGTLGAAEDTAIDIPHIWLYLAELLNPMLHQGGISMGHLFREIAKPLLPLGKAGKLVVEILKLSCKEMGPEKVGAMWTEAGLMWSEFLPESLDTHKFVVDQEMEFTLREESVKRNPLLPHLC